MSKSTPTNGAAPHPLPPGRSQLIEIGRTATDGLECRNSQIVYGKMRGISLLGFTLDFHGNEVAYPKVEFCSGFTVKVAPHLEEFFENLPRTDSALRVFWRGLMKDFISHDWLPDHASLPHTTRITLEKQVMKQVFQKWYGKNTEYAAALIAEHAPSSNSRTAPPVRITSAAQSTEAGSSMASTTIGNKRKAADEEFEDGQQDGKKRKVSAAPLPITPGHIQDVLRDRSISAQNQLLNTATSNEASPNDQSTRQASSESTTKALATVELPLNTGGSASKTGIESTPHSATVAAQNSNQAQDQLHIQAHSGAPVGNERSLHNAQSQEMSASASVQAEREFWKQEVRSEREDARLERAEMRADQFKMQAEMLELLRSEGAAMRKERAEMRADQATIRADIRADQATMQTEIWTELKKHSDNRTTMMDQLLKDGLALLSKSLSTGKPASATRHA